MSLSPEQLATFPPRLQRAYAREPERYGPAMLATLSQLAGQGIEVRPLPPLHEQAVNFLGAVASHVAGGMQQVDDAEKARRLAVCGSCPNFLPTDQRCSVCGCWMAIKAAWAQEKCPQGLW